MLSIPPAIMALYSPALILFAAIITAFRDEPQTLLIVVAAIEFGKPAPSATCRAGACPAPAWSTCPNNTSSTMPLEGSILQRPSNSLTALIPSSTALKLERLPRNFPIGVLATPQIATLAINNPVRLDSSTCARTEVFLCNGYSPEHGQVQDRHRDRPC